MLLVYRTIILYIDFRSSYFSEKSINSNNLITDSLGISMYIIISFVKNQDFIYFFHSLEFHLLPL